MKVTYNHYNQYPNPWPCTVEREKINALKLIGSGLGQLVLKNKTCINALKIDRIKAKLLKSNDHLFTGKVIKNGTIRKEIFYIDPQSRLRYMTEDVPFMLTVEIPGLKPGSLTKVQNHLLDISVDYSLTPTNRCIPGCLRQIIVAHILVNVLEWRQLDVVTKVNMFPSVYSSGVINRTKNYY